MRRSEDYRIDPAFRTLITDSEFQSLESHSDSAYGVWRDFTISYLNPAWFHFAESNGAESDFDRAWRLGRNIFEAIPKPLGIFYYALYNSVLEQEPGYSHTVDYDCSTPTHSRTYTMMATCLKGGLGLVITNYHRSSRPILPYYIEGRAFEEAILTPDKKIITCAHCRKIKRFTPEENWIRVTDFIESPPENQRMELCPICTDKFANDAMGLPV